MKGVYSTIPFELCEFALLQRKVNQTKLYIYLKLHSTGEIPFTDNIFDNHKVWANHINLTPKTVKKCLRWLVKKKWITINSKKKKIRVIGYNKLCNKLYIISQTAAIFEQEDYDLFKAFCCAVVIEYYARKKHWIDNNRSASKKGGVTLNRNVSPRGYFEIPNQYLATCLGVSKTTAHNYKMEAIKANYIERKSCLRICENKMGEKVSCERYDELEKINPKYLDANLRRYRKGKKYLKFVESDAIKPYIPLKRKRIK